MDGIRGACVRNLGDYGELGVHVIPHMGDVCRETSGTVDGREPDTGMHEGRVIQVSRLSVANLLTT